MILMMMSYLVAGCKKQPPLTAVAAPSCERPDGMFGPVILPDGAHRYGEGQRSLAKTATSPSQPIEVCGVSQQLSWLLGAQCPDGSSPFTDSDRAHAARAGNIGEAGRCGSIVDRYVVPCPGGPVEVFMDLYMCRADEQF